MIEAEWEQFGKTVDMMHEEDLHMALMVIAGKTLERGGVGSALMAPEGVALTVMLTARPSVRALMMSLSNILNQVP